MIVDGKIVASRLIKKISEEIGNKQIGDICFVVIGGNSVGNQYVRMKTKLAESLGIKTRIIDLGSSSTFEQVKNKIESLVKENIGGVVIQLPLPDTLPTQDVLNLIPVEYDIDVLSDRAKELYKNNLLDKVPPVARAVSEILNFYSISMLDKDVLVIGSGRLVGEPVCSMLHSNNIHFDVIDKNTDPIISKALITGADIIITGVGSPGMIKPEMIKDGVVIIDAGTSEQEGKMVGDVDPKCSEKASLFTPVPGGVGPVTLASLFLNLL